MIPSRQTRLNLEESQKVYRLVPFKDRHIQTMDIRMLDQIALTGLDLNELVKVYQKSGPLLSLLVNEECIAVIGMCLLWNGVGEVYMLTGEEIENNKVYFCKTMKRLMKEYTNKHKLHRIQCIVHELNTRSLNWLVRFMGFEIEGKMKSYGPDKANYYRLAKV